MAPLEKMHNAKATVTKSVVLPGDAFSEFGQTTVRHFRRAGTVASAGVALVAIVGQLGYVPELQVLHGDYIPMAPASAGCFLILSVALFCSAQERWQASGLMARVSLVLVTMVFGFMEAIQPLVGIELENWLIPQAGMLGAIPIGRMSPITGVGFFIAGLGTFLLIQWRSSRYADRRGNWASSLGVLTVLIGTTVLLAYVYGTPLMYGGSTVPMAATTAFAFIFLGVALVAAAGPQRFPTRLVLGDSTAARLSRAFLPLSLAAVFLQSVLSRFLSASFVGQEAVFLAVLVIGVATITMFVVARVAHSTGSRLDEVSKKLLESEARFRSLTSLSSDYYWETDIEHQLMQRTDNHNRGLVGSIFRLESPIGQRRWDIPYLSPGEHAWQAHRAMLDAHLPFRQFVFSRLAADGNERYVSISGDPVFDASGNFTGYRGVGTDITDRKRMEDQVRQMAFYDTLTNLPNRRLLNDRLSQAIATSKRSGRDGALLFLDLDNFKSLNDMHGHEIGDWLLVEAANRLKSCVREIDTVARFGGDEFVVVIGELDVDRMESAAQARIIAEKIRAALAAPYVLQVRHEESAKTTIKHQCTATIGVVLFGKQGTSQEDILKRADRAMYQGKTAEGNLVRLYE